MSRSLPLVFALAIAALSVVNIIPGGQAVTSSDDDPVNEWERQLMETLESQRSKENAFLKKIEGGGDFVKNTVENITASQYRLEKFWEDQQQWRQKHQITEIKHLVAEWQKSLKKAFCKLLCSRASDPAEVQKLKHEVNATLHTNLEKQNSDLSVLMKNFTQEIKNDMSEQKEERRKQIAGVKKWSDNMTNGMKEAKETIEALSEAWTML